MDRMPLIDQYLQSGGTDAGRETSRNRHPYASFRSASLLRPAIFLPRSFVFARMTLIVGALAATLWAAPAARAQDPLPELEVVDRDAVTPSTRNTAQLRDWQVGYFRRGSSAVVVTAFDIS